MNSLTTPQHPIVIHGWGNMGSAIGRCILNANPYHPLVIIGKEGRPAPVDITTYSHVTYYEGENAAAEALHNAPLYIIAVKPQDCAPALKQAAHYLSVETAVLSVMAGIKTSYLSHFMPLNPKALAMPNLASLSGHGMTGYFLDNTISEEQTHKIETCLQGLGRMLRVEKEADIDCITAVSGSGPAYYFYWVEYISTKTGLSEDKIAEAVYNFFSENVTLPAEIDAEFNDFKSALLSGAVCLGFSEDQASLLVNQTLLGAAYTLVNSDLHASVWRQKVSSKGGTSLAALSVMQGAGEDFYNAIPAGMTTARDRGVELNEEQMSKLTF